MISFLSLASFCKLKIFKNVHTITITTILHISLFRVIMMRGSQNKTGIRFFRKVVLLCQIRNLNLV